MAYRVEFTSQARKQLEALPRPAQQRLIVALEKLADDPRPPGIKAMKGPWRGHYRLRVGSYRAIYTVHDERVVVEVVRIGDRKEIY
jgi:mRNA interferase RelE/StbE